MVLAGQNDVMILQDLYPDGQAEVSVRPLVDLKRFKLENFLLLKDFPTCLIRDGDKDGAEKEISAERILSLNLGPRAAVKDPRELSQDRQRHHEVIAVGLDPVVSRD